jgi:hypothetical protein
VAAGRAFSSAIVELALANFPGIYFTAAPGAGSAYGAYWPGLVRQDRLQHEVVHASGDRELIPPPTAGAERVLIPTPSATAERASPTPGGETQAGETGVSLGLKTQPLGRIVDARSGDKGGNANLGVWVRHTEHWPWLKDTLTADALQALLPEIAGLPVERYLLPNLHAVNFVISGLLDGGATEARRYDKQAKSLGEWLRARVLPAPSGD